MSHPLPASSPGIRPIGMSAFDSALIMGVFLLASCVVAFASLAPQYLWLLVLADVWLLGYHHVIATFTKLAGTSADRQKNSALIWVALPVVLVATTAIGLAFGVVAIVTVYFFWQWFHYVRQSWGISRRYQGNSVGKGIRSFRGTELMFWSIPVWGLLHRCQQNPDTFLWLPVWLPAVPAWLGNAAGVVALVVTGMWIRAQARAVLEGEADVRHSVYVASHLLVFAVGYIAIQDVTIGWLFVNVWHNAQYLLFVWRHNKDRFGGSEPQGFGLPWLSQPGAARMAAYFAACLLASTSLYALVTFGGAWIAAPSPATAAGAASIPVVVLAAMTLNFHHYVVDSLIWKRRRDPGGR